MNKVSQYTLTLLIIAVLSSGALTAYTIYTYIYAAQTRTQAIKKENKQSLKKIIALLDTKLLSITKAASKLADNSELYKIASTKKNNLLEETIKENNAIHSIGIVYAPYAYSKEKKYYSIQYKRESTSIKYSTIEEFYDYTKTSWFATSKISEPQWIEPYFESSLNTIITRYIHPIFKYNPQNKQREYFGTLLIDISIEYLNTMIASLSINKDNFAMIIARNGTLLAHPLEEYVKKHKTIFDIAQLPGKKDYIILGNAITKEEEGSLLLYDTFIQKSYEALYKAVPSTPWTLIIVSPAQQKLVPTTAIRRMLIHILLAIAFFLFCLCSLLFGAYKGNIKTLWIISSISSLLLLNCIISIWGLDVISTEHIESHENIMDSDMSLDRFFYVHKRLNPQLYKQKTHFIPTGLFIFSIDLAPTDPNVTINGHIWQKYHQIKDADLSHGVIIFNAVDQSFDKIYEHTDDDIKTIGWRFKIKIKGNFDYTKYPFDQQNLLFTLGHKDYKTNIILTPDFEAFGATTQKNPEIDPIINIGQWETKETYSFYQLTDFVTDFGIEDYTRQKEFPNLSFNILVQRNFVDPLIASFLPISIILMIIFSILLITGLSKKQDGLATLILRLCSSIFFATAIAHQTFQRTLQSPTITYFEYFYFVLYAIILFTTINGMLYGFNKGNRLITYKNNIITRLLYWPIALSALLANTLSFFY